MVWRNTAIWDGRSLKKINHVTVNPQIDCDLMWLDASSPLPSMMLPSLPDVRAIWLRISAPFPELHGLHWLHCQGHFVAPFPTFFHPKVRQLWDNTFQGWSCPVTEDAMTICDLPWLYHVVYQETGDVHRLKKNIYQKYIGSISEVITHRIHVWYIC